MLSGLTTLLLLAIASTVHAQNGAQFKDWKPSSLTDAVQVKPRLLCTSLTSLTDYDLSISSAKLVPAAGEVPEHCRISGQSLPEVRFELSLPSIWNGRLYMFGNGGSLANRSMLPFAWSVATGR